MLVSPGAGGRRSERRFQRCSAVGSALRWRGAAQPAPAHAVSCSVAHGRGTRPGGSRRRRRCLARFSSPVDQPHRSGAAHGVSRPASRPSHSSGSSAVIRVASHPASAPPVRLVATTPRRASSGGSASDVSPLPVQSAPAPPASPPGGAGTRTHAAAEPSPGLGRRRIARRIGIRGRWIAQRVGFVWKRIVGLIGFRNGERRRMIRPHSELPSAAEPGERIRPASARRSR